MPAAPWAIPAPAPAANERGRAYARAGKPGLAVVLALCVGATLAFLAVPIVALFAEVPLGEVPRLLGEPVVQDALRVTARTNIVGNLLILGFGTPTAYFLATRRFRGRALVVALVELPLVLPPAVAGIGLLAAFGVGGLIGPDLADAVIVLPFFEWAVVLAVTFVRVAVLHAPGDHRLRGGRPHVRRRRPHARRRSSAHLLADLRAAGRERPRRRS